MTVKQWQSVRLCPVMSVGLATVWLQHGNESAPGGVAGVAGPVSRTVQELLGHKDVGTTIIYCHVLNSDGRGVVSPLDPPSPGSV